jgi:chorismate mutase
MDNRINEIRRKISSLRAEMGSLEVTIRQQVSQGLDCAEAAHCLMAMRAEVVERIGQWKAAGGGERLPAGREPLKTR